MTPALTGTLLPGVTRDSLLTLAPDLGIPAEEGAISVAAVAGGLRVRRDHRGVRLRDGGRDHPGRRGQGPRRATGRSAAASLARSPCGCGNSCSGIQFGQLPDPHGWVHKIC